jgi:hypothetical protein
MNMTEMESTALKDNYQSMVCLLALMCVILLGGCKDSSSPFEYIPVSGKATYEDGTPIKAGIRLQFKSLDQNAIEAAHPRPALTTLDAEGRFENVTSYKYGDGLVPGKHQVAILDADNLVPQEYTNVNSSPLIVDTASLPLEIKVPKP